MMFKPEVALETIIIYLWLECLLSGILWVVFAVLDKEYEDRRVLAAVAIIQILVWVLLVAYPAAWEAILKGFVILAWVWAIIRWILAIIDSINLKKLKFASWWCVLAAWIILIIVGLFLVTNSLLTILIINGVLWIWLVFTGVSMIVLALQVKKNVKALIK